ncbi:MAG: hypothetical protein ABIG20_04815 [archaeon]
MKLGNRKGQFFIAAGVIMIMTIAIIFHFVVNVEEVDSAGVVSSDAGFFFKNIRDEYGMVTEICLENASQEGLDPTQSADVLDANISNFTEFVKEVARWKGMDLQVSTQRNTANNSFMNTTVNLTLKTQSNELYSSFEAVRGIQVEIENLIASSTGPPTCTLNITGVEFNVTKEHYEPMPGLDTTTFGDLIADISGCGTVTNTCTYTEVGGGKYAGACSPLVLTCPCPTTVEVTQDVVDRRNIYGAGTRSFPVP